MPDRERVIKGLELCTAISQDGCLMLCPYKDEQDETYSGFCEQVLKRDALDLLKEQQQKIDALEDQNIRLIQQKKELTQRITQLQEEKTYTSSGIYNLWEDE